MRTVEEVYQEMLSDFQTRIGETVDNNCDLAVRLYAVAAQVSALETQAEWVKDQCFPQTAQGIYLDYHAQMRALTRQSAIRATGTLRFSVRVVTEEDLPIPIGTVCISTSEMHYETVEEAVLPAGELFVEIPARAMEPGAAGNTAAGSILTMSVPPAGISHCTNFAAFTGGEDAESDESLRARILDSYQRLPNGANTAFYESQAMLHEGVVAAKAVGRARGVGTVNVYVATSAGMPDAALLQEIQTELAEKREIAVDVQVLEPEKQAVDVEVTLEVASGADKEAVRTAAEATVRGYFSGALLGKGVQLSQLYALLHGMENVNNYYINAPAADLAAKTTVLPQLGTLQIHAQ